MRKLQLGLQMDKEHETDWWATAKKWTQQATSTI